MALAHQFFYIKWNQQVICKLDFQGSRLGLKSEFLGSASRKRNENYRGIGGGVSSPHVHWFVDQG
jgi:hypothetical protein